MGRMALSAQEAVAAAAAEVRPHLPGAPIIGLAVPPGLDIGTIGLVHSDALHPFVAAGVMGTRTVAVLPDARQVLDPARILAIRMLRALGGALLVSVGCCTALRPRFRVGSLVAVADHLNLTGTSPLVGPNDERMGPRFPSLAEPYDIRLLDQAEQIALHEGVALPRSVYAGIAGPDLPTAAECRFLTFVGADVYGFGLVPDTLTAVHTGLRVLGLAVVTAGRLPDGRSTGDPEAAAISADVASGLARCLVRLMTDLSSP